MELSKNNALYKGNVPLDNEFKRKEYINEHARFLKERLTLAFADLKDQKFILEHSVYLEENKRANMVFHATYDCITINNIKVQFQFVLDLRNLFNRNKIEFANSRFCKIQVPVHSRRYGLYNTVRHQLVIWNTGALTETLFLSFLQSISSRYSRIVRVYKTSVYSDKVLGIDFVVCLLTKPYYEEKKIFFNVKSSENFLEKHKSKFPNISTFVFSKMYLSDENALEKNFLRFLIRASKETVHM